MKSATVTEIGDVIILSGGGVVICGVVGGCGVWLERKGYGSLWSPGEVVVLDSEVYKVNDEGVPTLLHDGWVGGGGGQRAKNGDVWSLKDGEVVRSTNCTAALEGCLHANVKVEQAGLAVAAEGIELDAKDGLWVRAGGGVALFDFGGGGRAEPDFFL